MEHFHSDGIVGFEVCIIYSDKLPTSRDGINGSHKLNVLTAKEV